MSGDLWFDASPAPDWGLNDVTKTFTLPAAAVAEPGRIKWARLYVSAYCGHMQNDYAFTITNRWDGNGDGIYEQTWPETGHAGFNFAVNGGNDNSAFPGHGTGEPYRMISDHENRVTSDYFMWYDVAELIDGQTVKVNVNTQGSFDGRIKVITLVIAYDDGDSDRVQYWVNQGHDSLSYYCESDYGYIALGSTTFATAGVTNITSATLTSAYMASNNGFYGFPSADYAEDYVWQGDPPSSSGYFIHPIDRAPDVQGAYSGVKSWNVTSMIDGSGDVTLGYSRWLQGTGTSAFFKIPLAFLVVRREPLPPAPQANFTENATSGYVPLTVKFTDLSTNATAWAWDFDGDGTADSTQQNPIHTYNTSGSFNVSLKVTGPGGADSVTKYGLVTAALPPIPVAAFTANVTSGYVPLAVQFNDMSSNYPAAWAWDFDGDGTVDSTQQNPVHTYNASGNYTVRLDISNAGGSNATAKHGYIVAVLPPAPVADFSAAPENGTVPLTVQFTDRSTNAPTSWLWDFGDGNTSTDQNTSHTYVAVGNYTVSLNASNAGGSGLKVKDGLIFVKPPAPVASLTSNVTFGIAPLTVQFTDRSTNAPTSWLWDFGDGNTSLEQNPVHTYAGAGTYTVSLMAGNAGGSNTSSFSGYIMVTDRPVFYVSPASLVEATGNEVSFDIMAQSLPNGLDEYSLIITIPSFVNVTGVAYPGWAAVNTTSSSGGSLGLSARDAGGLVQGGAADVRLATITVRCESPGEAALALSDASMKDDDGVPSTPVTIGGNLAVYVPLVADFAASATEGLVPLTVNFTDLSAGTPAPSSWLWDFGDGNSSGQRNVTHTYLAPGNYTVNLTVTNKYCQNSTTAYVNATIPRPIANFAFDVSYGPAPLTVQFNDTSVGDPTTWAWDFGDGNTSAERNPAHTYCTPNAPNPPYTVSLTVSNAAGSDTKTIADLISVTYPLPVANFIANRTYGEVPLSIQFTDTSTNANAWAWDFDNDGNVDSRLRDPAYTYTANGRYTVNLTVTGPGGTDSEVRLNYIVAGNLTQCDLLFNGTINPSPAYVFAREPNTIKIYNIKNNGSEQSPATEVELRSSDGFVGRAAIPALAAGSQTTVTIEDTTIRSTAGSSVTYTAILDPDNDVLETNESNNQKSSNAKTVIYNGYKGKRYWDGGKDDSTVKTYDLRGGIVYSFGDSVYVSGSFGANGWNSYSVKWTAGDLKIPDNATVVAARLYVPYTWDNSGVAPDHVHITFNGQDTVYEHWYHDVSNFGAYYDHVYGLLTYDVTALYKKNADNKALFTRDGDPNTKISMAGFTLAVVYEEANATRKQIFLNEEFDLLGADPSFYGTNSSEATAYVPFSGMTIDMANVSHAYLVTFVPWGSGPEGNLLLNGNVIATNVWDHGPTYGPQVAVDSRDVKQYLKASGNVAGIQSTEGDTPCMAAVQEFLVVEYVTPGAVADEALNETLGGPRTDTNGSATFTSSSRGGAGEGTDTGAVSSGAPAGGTALLPTVLALLLVVGLAGASGVVLYYIINGKMVPGKIGIPALIAAILLVAAVGGFVVGQSVQGTGAGHNSSVADVTADTPNASFSVIPAVQDIQDNDQSNLVPDYPADFEADNGILFVHEKGDAVKADEISIRLEARGEEVTIGPSDKMPPDRCTSDKVTGYIREVGGSDGIVSVREWLMLYADGCLRTPGGNAISWNPSGTAFVLFEGEICDYTILDASGRVIDKGTFQFNP